MKEKSLTWLVLTRICQLVHSLWRTITKRTTVSKEDDQVDNDDNDGGQSRPKQKDKSVKRKRAPRKQKETTRAKRQHTSGDTSPVGDDSTVSSQTIRELMTEMSDRFTKIVQKEISAMERRIKRRLTRVEDSVAKLVDARHQVTNLFSLLTGITHVDGTQGKGDGTPGDDTHVYDTRGDDTHVYDTHGRGDGGGDGTRGDGTHDDGTHDDGTHGDGTQMLNVGSDYFATNDFFVELESPTCWLSNEHIDAYMSLLCKQRELKVDEYKSNVAVLCTDFFGKLCQEWVKFQPPEDAPMTCAFDALSFQCPDDWMLYASGDKPGWGSCWTSAEYVSTINVTHFELYKYTKRY
ncbi:hypothetical protein QYF36_001470 [Acer negundo]|nr:hypothetical protein QYF36_001470 [Acer negundo]